MATSPEQAKTARRRNTDFTAEFLGYLQQRELRYARDRVTGRPIGYTGRLVDGDPAAGPEWILATGDATLLSFVIYHQAYSETFPTPYNVALVALAEGPTLIATVAAANAADLVIGAKLKALFEADGRLVFALSSPD